MLCLIGSWFVLSHSASLLMVSGHHILRILGTFREAAVLCLAGIVSTGPLYLSCGLSGRLPLSFTYKHRRMLFGLRATSSLVLHSIMRGG